MRTKIVEANNGRGNWGKFLVGQFDDAEWSRRSALPGEQGQPALLWRLGWSRNEFIFVLDLQTGEGAVFRHGGFAPADLNKHKIWVCPLYEGFLIWLYQQDISDLNKLPDWVDLDVPFDMSGYRRPGPAELLLVAATSALDFMPIGQPETFQLRAAIAAATSPQE